MRRKILARKRRRFDYRYTGLVLRQRNDGHDAEHSQSDLGLQRHRAARRGLSGGSFVRPSEKGIPAFGIYGRDVQDGGDETIPDDVQEKLLQFARAALAVASMKGTSYLAMGGVSMGIAGSIVDQPFFEEYLGMRVESGYDRIRAPFRARNLR